MALVHSSSNRNLHCSCLAAYPVIPREVSPTALGPHVAGLVWGISPSWAWMPTMEERGLGHPIVGTCPNPPGRGGGIRSTIYYLTMSSHNLGWSVSKIHYLFITDFFWQIIPLQSEGHEIFDTFSWYKTLLGTYINGLKWFLKIFYFTKIFAKNVCPRNRWQGA